MWDGTREETKDKGCCNEISEGWSGYCECANGTIAMKKGCEKGTYSRCNEACKTDHSCGKLSFRIV